MMAARGLDWSARRAALSPDRVAFVDPEGAKVTFAGFDRRVNRAARWLEARGVKAGARVAVLAHNRLEVLEVWFAVQKLGAVLQALNWRLPGPTLRALVERARPAVLLYDGACATLAEQVGADAVALDGAFAARAALSDAPLGRAPPPPEAPWVLCYTGGSTGVPKAAVLRQRGILANAINTAVSWQLSASDVAILNAPLFHTGGLNVFTAPLFYLGGCSIVCPRFEVTQVFDLLDEGATVFFGVPTMFQMLQAHPRWAQADLSRLKLVISGGAPCPAPVFERFFERGVAFRTGYGLTEAGPNNFWLPEPRVRSKPGCVGQPLMHVEARLVDPEGQVIDLPGREGELCLRGPHVMSGYDGDEAATRAVLDEEGWLRTGDLARFDEDGDFTICGRKKDLVISGGENVYPARVESVLCAHEAVAGAAVLGRPDDRWGEVPVAFVVTGRPLEPDALVAFARERLAGYEVPKAIFFVDALPLTGAGKVDKRALAARLSRTGSS